MTANRRSLATLLAALPGAAGSFAVGGVLALSAGCDGGATKSDAGEPTDGFDRRAMLAHLGTDVLLPVQREVAAKVALVPPAIAAYCDALDAGDPGATLDAARTAFVDAIDVWEEAEAVLVGPAAMDNKTLRGLIYSWPLISPCELDKDTASRWANPGSYDVDAKLVNARSLSAVEYLLYPPSDDHNCSQPPPGWTALGADLPKARCRLALELATDAAAKAQELEMAWAPEGGNYAGELAMAGASGSMFPTAHAAVNVLSDSLFYVDAMVKQMKLAEAAGIAVNACQTVQEPCIREVELRFADRATFAIRRNLAAYRAVFTGKTATTDGPGFDDFLIELGHPDVADRMTASIDAAIAKADALPDSFLGALASNYDDVSATHTALKAVTDDLKSQFLTLLALEIPDDVATDND